MNKSLFVFFLLIFISLTQGFSQSFLMNNVHIVSMENDQVQANQSIQVENGRIIQITPMSEPSKFKGDLIIDGGEHMFIQA